MRCYGDQGGVARPLPTSFYKVKLLALRPRTLFKRGGLMVTDREKYLVAVLMLLVWGDFVYLELTPAAAFIQMIHDIILGLGIFTATQAMPPTK